MLMTGPQQEAMARESKVAIRRTEKTTMSKSKEYGGLNGHTRMRVYNRAPESLTTLADIAASLVASVAKQQSETTVEKDRDKETDR